MSERTYVGQDASGAGRPRVPARGTDRRVVLHERCAGRGVIVDRPLAAQKRQGYSGASE
jgi:hypothetical protein